MSTDIKYKPSRIHSYVRANETSVMIDGSSRTTFAGAATHVTTARLYHNGRTHMACHYDYATTWYEGHRCRHFHCQQSETGDIMSGWTEYETGVRNEIMERGALVRFK